MHLICSELPSRRDTHLVLELLTELQGDGEEYQRVIKPGHHTLHLVNVAHLKPVVVELAVEESVPSKQQKKGKRYTCTSLFESVYVYCVLQKEGEKLDLQHRSRVMQH